MRRLIFANGIVVVIGYVQNHVSYIGMFYMASFHVTKHKLYLPVLKSHIKIKLHSFVSNKLSSVTL